MKKAKQEALARPEGLYVPETVMLPVSAANMAPYNPRVMRPEQQRALRASLLKHGMVLNLVVQRASAQYGKMVLIGGHQRVKEMRALCQERAWPEPGRVPMVILDVEDSEAKQLNVALNNIEGEFDPYKLGELFASIRDKMTLEDIEATGFTAEQVDEAVSIALPPEEQAVILEDEVGGADLGAFARSITLSVEFDSAEERDKAKDLLRKMAADQAKRAGAVLLKALRAHQASAPKPKSNGRREAAATRGA